MNQHDLQKQLRQYADKNRAASSARFFKTAPGQYGHGDLFLGLTVPQQRLVAARFTDLTLSQIKDLLSSKYHEDRLTALIILVTKYKEADSTSQIKIANFYLKNLKRINNWDLVDTSAPYILGHYLYNTKNKTTLLKLARAKDLWSRRVAIVATLYFIKYDHFDTTLQIAELLLADKHDLIHKAVGWALREVYKKSPVTAEKFLKKHIKKIPRTSLRYAIEKMPPTQRRTYLRMK